MTIMHEAMNDPVQVAALFRDGRAVPFKFLWNGREYPIKAINLTYSEFEGRAKVYYFAVSDQDNYFKLRFDSSDLTWRLVETYSD